MLAKAPLLALTHMLGIAGNVAAEEPARLSLERRKNVPKRQQKSGTAFCIPKLIFSDLMKNRHSLETFGGGPQPFCLLMHHNLTWQNMIEISSTARL